MGRCGVIINKQRRLAESLLDEQREHAASGQRGLLQVGAAASTHPQGLFTTLSEETPVMKTANTAQSEQNKKDINPQRGRPREVTDGRVSVAAAAEIGRR